MIYQLATKEPYLINSVFIKKYHMFQKKEKIERMHDRKQKHFIGFIIETDTPK